MDAIKAIEQLAHHAMHERIPPMHIVDQVMEAIQSSLPEGDALLGWLGAGAALAASIVFVMGLQAWKILSHPLVQMMIPLQDIRLW